ncbi:hypothetical protein OIU85_019020 [Salix viminalis]|uniref:Uncharacterized protein n=1 Tax=Salix viminalis TaxID=40686 RepID=A0A9Q0ZJG7_SALVM|nr:hypothetical protein OIU85_019020 [Salix viminalis]
MAGDHMHIGFNGGSPFAADLVAFHWPFSTLIFALQPASWGSGTMGSAIDGSNVWFGSMHVLWGDGERMPRPLRLHMNPRLTSFCRRPLLIFPSELDM